MKNNTADDILSVLNDFITPDPNFFWKIIIKMVDENKKLIFCIKFIMKLTEQRMKI